MSLRRADESYCSWYFLLMQALISFMRRRLVLNSSQEWLFCKACEKSFASRMYKSRRTRRSYCSNALSICSIHCHVQVSQILFQ